MYSPKGRPVVELFGDASTIRSRGTQITSLGRKMESSSTLLRGLIEDSAGMKGEAVEKLQEVVGDTHVALADAAKLYKPTGPILVSYADALDVHQPRIRTLVEECGDAQQAYSSAPGYREGERPFWAQPAPWRSDEEKERMGEENEADDLQKEKLYDSYRKSLKDFDDAVDSWELAFDEAADKIDDAFKGKIEDGFWDNVDGFVAGVVKVLQVVGTIVAIAAIIIGGPIFAIIGGIIAVATLALVAYQFFRGDASGWDLALAIIGVIPFGSLGKLAQGKQGLVNFAGDAVTAFKPSTWSAAAGQLNNMAMAGRFAGGGFTGMLQSGRTLWQLNNPAGVGDVMARFIFGKNTTGLVDLTDAMSNGARGWQYSPVLPAAWEFTHMVIGSPIKTVDKILEWTGNGDKKITKQVPWLGAIL